MIMNKALLYIATISLAAVSCGDFLDTVPDDRIELDSKDKVTKMLVSAYPTVSTMLISELSSDNATTTGRSTTPTDRSAVTLTSGKTSRLTTPTLPKVSGTRTTTP